jgi:hypothetical protein
MRSREKLPGPPKAEKVRSGKVEGNLETESEVGFYKKVRQEVFLSNASEDLRTEENDVESHSRPLLRVPDYIEFQDVLGESKIRSF